MRRVVAMLGTASLFVVIGCGVKDYERRLDLTLDDMKYQERLNRNLGPAEVKPKWDDLSIYLRPPLNLKPSKDRLLPETEKGKFDLEASFDEPQKQRLHVLARLKLAKNAPKKKGAPPPTVDRSNFNRDITDVLTTMYSPPEEVNVARVKAVKKKSNDYKTFTFSVNENNIDVYLYKQGDYDVALIFDYPKSEKNNLVSKIDLSLESFAVGTKAKRYFSGATSDQDAESQGPGVVF